jgi:para-aminobenzoate synthetase/4-amino-4-deoxychorismate lyase
VEQRQKRKMLKAQLPTTNLPDFSLLETMLWVPDDGYFLLSYHLKRLYNSADYFNIAVDIENVQEKIEVLASSLPNEPHKVRLLISQNGNITCEAIPLSCDTAPQSLKLNLSLTPVNSTNPFLYHKTTNRQIYNSARASCPDCNDVLLWNERLEITEMCFANVVVKMNNQLLTPPVQCGLLPGTFRAYLLDIGKVREGIITVEALFECEGIYAINSVRKWRQGFLLGNP